VDLLDLLEVEADAMIVPDQVLTRPPFNPLPA
jgi:hypothetical protein